MTIQNSKAFLEQDTDSSDLDEQISLLEPSVEPSLEPSVEPSLEPSLEPALESKGPKEVKGPKFRIPTPEWRTDLYEELHARPFPLIQTPARVSHLAVLHDSSLQAENNTATPVRGSENVELGRRAEIEHLKALCKRYSTNCPSDDASCFHQDLGECEIRWERHTEFSTYTFIRKSECDAPFSHNAIDFIAKDWVAGIRGEIASASHIEVLSEQKESPSTDELHSYFEGQRLIGCSSLSDGAKIWTAFRLHEDGFARFVIYNNSLNNCETGRLVQKLLEIETYRLIALLTLPISKLALHQINAIDLQLSSSVDNIPKVHDHKGEKHLLEQLSVCSAQVETIRSKITYRASATRAYYALVMKRLDELDQAPLHGIQTLEVFLDRRFTPAIRTVESIYSRLEDLSARIDRATDLIRTRVDLSIEEQNQTLLTSMNDRSKRQHRLQRTVEGFSVIAISYYIIELIKLGLPGAKHLGLQLSADELGLYSLPLVFAGVCAVGILIRKKTDS